MDTCGKSTIKQSGSVQVKDLRVKFPGATDHVELLLQCLDLRLDHLQEALHFLIAGDGATGGSWGTNHSHMWN